MTETHNQLDRRSAADLLEATPDWVMLAIIVVLIAGWLSWIAVAGYRLFMVP
jgi:hypothetical protein